MAANIAKINRFVELRAEGLSYREISKEINVSKPTLIKWSKENKDKIEKFAEILEEQFIAEERIKRTVRAKMLSEELDRAYESLNRTGYEDLSKRELINIIEKLEKNLESYTKPDNHFEQEKYNIIITRKNPEDVSSKQLPVISDE